MGSSPLALLHPWSPFTGSEGLLALTVGGAAVLGVGGGIVYAARRKKAGAAS
ncbi:LPXTG cell wall anchor domain-containing protein [Kitasatospora sp. NPDC051984]|uniref:LPXTG cell wall anchor domain-containing protein n=1 Tax=Kitasatospora sp. NPDC051984 TaxID=3364059 RepID=UPI0037C62FF9